MNQHMDNQREPRNYGFVALNVVIGIVAFGATIATEGMLLVPVIVIGSLITIFARPKRTKWMAGSAIIGELVLILLFVIYDRFFSK